MNVVTLKVEPSGVVRSLDELLALALALEHRSAIRYAELAERARTEGLTEVTAVFERLASEERQHESAVERWAQHKIDGALKSGVHPAVGTDTFDEETAAELASSRIASPYRVLSMAVRNEERAFLFWTYIAANADTAEMVDAAERIAHEELEHAALLRRARRDAYRSERQGLPRKPPRSITTRLAQAASRERLLAADLEVIARQSEGDIHEDARALSSEAKAMAAQLRMLAGRNDAPVHEIEDGLARAEQLVEDYLDLADHARDEELVATMQESAQRAILRLAWLRAVAGRVPLTAR